MSEVVKNLIEGRSAFKKKKKSSC